jgi:hypothetical protein
MKKSPYPALVKPDAVVLLPPEESEERLPRGLWPEERRRPPWVMPAVIGAIFVAGLGLGLRLASRSPSAEANTPQAAEGPFASVDSGEDVGAMDAAVVPETPPPEPAQREGPPAPVELPPTWDGVTGGSRSGGAAPPPAVASRQEPELEPELRADAADQGAAVALAQRTTPDREARSTEPRDELRGETAPRARDDAPEPALTPSAPAVQPGRADSTPVELGPAPVGRTTIVPVEPIELAARSAVALEPPAPDPAMVREAARRSLLRGAERFASAVGQARTGSTSALSGQILASDGPARELLRFVQQSKPGASVVRVGEVTVRDGTAQADATLQLEWRGDFGVTRRGSVRVRLLAREGDDGWSVAGGQPLDGSPR